MILNSTFRATNTEYNSSHNQ